MKRQHNYAYLAIDTKGNKLSIYAPNAKEARNKALQQDVVIESCRRLFKRGGELGAECMNRGDIFNAWWSDIDELLAN